MAKLTPEEKAVADKLAARMKVSAPCAKYCNLWRDDPESALHAADLCRALNGLAEHEGSPLRFSFADVRQPALPDQAKEKKRS